jgi:1-acyl-sn-glycerol-3-phosphate acyltransferase
MIYRAIRALARLLLSVFYHRVEIVGLEHVPASGPLVIVANHHNALVDPALLVAAILRQLVPIAKAPLFRHPLVGPILRLVGAIPVHRRQEGLAATEPARNAPMFARAIETLRGGGGILIFPEGMSQPEPTLMPLRTGVARLVLGAERAEPGLEVPVLPVGLVFHRPGTFRAGWALVVIGEPLRMSNAIARFAHDPEEAVRDMTDAVARSLRRLIVETSDRQTLRLLHLIERLWRDETDAAAPSAALRAEQVQRVARARTFLLPRVPQRVESLRQALEDYDRDLEAAGISSVEVGQAYPVRVVVRYTLRESLSLLLGLPLALLGVVMHYVPYRLAGRIARWLGTEADSVATYKLGAGIVVFPLCWLAEAWLAWLFAGGWGLGAVLAALVPSAFFALAWQQRLARVRREVRGFVHFVLDRDLHERLAARRRALIVELRTLAGLVPEEVLTGKASSS